MLVIKVLLVFVSLTVRASMAATQECLDIPSESNFHAEQLEGMWYPMEIVQHRNDSRIYGVPLDSKCPEVSFTRKGKTLIMVWNTTEGELKYTFTQRGSNRQPQWQATGEQTGSLANEMYKPYEGYIRLFKLDVDYFFLSFCSKKNVLLSTVPFSRRDEMPERVLNDVLHELKSDYRKKITNQIRLRPCMDEKANDSGRIKISSVLTLLPSVMAFLWSLH